MRARVGLHGAERTWVERRAARPCLTRVLLLLLHAPSSRAVRKHRGRVEAGVQHGHQQQVRARRGTRRRPWTDALHVARQRMQLHHARVNLSLLSSRCHAVTHTCRFFQYIPVVEDFVIRLAEKQCALESVVGPFPVKIRGEITSWDGSTGEMAFQFNTVDILLLGKQVRAPHAQPCVRNRHRVPSCWRACRCGHCVCVCVPSADVAAQAQN